MAIHELRAKRATAFDRFKALAEKPDFKPETDEPELAKTREEIKSVDAEIKRALEVQELDAAGAQPVLGQDGHPRVNAQAKDDPYTNDEAAKRRGVRTSKGLIVGGIAKMVVLAGGQTELAGKMAAELYGERHPIAESLLKGANVKALVAGVGSSGGFIVPPEYINEIIELLRPMAVVRASNPRTMPMPHGTMTLPAQTSAASANYGAERTPPSATQPSLGQIVATYKKLKALVPISNDLMRFADPAADAFVRDDLVKVMALREDLAFLIGDGTQDSPRGFLSFANSWAVANGGIAGAFLSTGNSTAASGGNFITSTASYELSTVAQEAGGLVNKLDTANVPDIRRKWFMHPRSWNYLNNVQNSLGLYVYRDELAKGAFLGYPFAKSTQIPTNIYNPDGSHTDCSFVFLVEMDDALILDAMTLELAISREGSYSDSNGVAQNAFANDETIIRAIMEHDFQMRHVGSIAVAQFVRWAPSIS